MVAYKNINDNTHFQEIKVDEEDNLVVVALHCAALEGNVTGLEELLALAKVDVHVTNKNGESTCHVAAGQGQIKVLEFLRSKNANFEQTDDTGATPLMWASRYGQVDTVRYLLKDVSITTQDEEGNTALHHSAMHGHFDVLHQFLEAGANLDLCNHSGSTPLHVALYNKHHQAAIFLIHAGTDIDIVDLNGEAAIHLAAREGMTVVAQTLCAFGCNVELSNIHGQYPLHLAAKHGHIDIVRCLCLAGCNIEQRSGDGIKAEIVAYKQGFNEISNLLHRLKNCSQREELIKQLIPTIQPLGRINVKIFGHSGVGKTTLISTLKAGYFSGLFRKAKSIQPNINIHNSNVSLKIKNDFDIPTKTYLGFNSNNYTRGIELHKVNLSGLGNVTLWDFSGQDTYFQMYDHFLGTTNCIHIILYNLEDSPSIQYQQCVFWFTFLQARIPPAEPLGENGIANRLAQVLIVATHPDSSKLYSQQNLYKTDQSDKLMEQLKRLFRHVFEIYPQVIIVDAQNSSSPGIKLIKNYLFETKQKILQTVPKWTGFLESVVEWLNNFRKASTYNMKEIFTGDSTSEIEQNYSNLFPIQSWRSFMQMVRTHVNPLAGEDHLRELLQQLIIMGEIILIKSHYEDLICTNPNWLCSTVIGTLLSIEFVARARVTGCYSIEDFQSAFPEADSLNILHILEALQLCTQCEVEDEEIEFEFPTFNFVEKIEGLWDSSDPRYDCPNSCYGGVRLKTPKGTCHLLHCIFPRLQVQFRRTTQRSEDTESDLYQWFEGSKLCSGSIESLVTLEEDEEVIEIKVRGPPGMQMACFYFIEELLGIIDQVLLEMSPGLPIEKHVLSSNQLRSHSEVIHSWPPEELMAAILQPEGFMSTLLNPITGDRESIVDLVAFSSCEIIEVILTGEKLPVSSLSTSCRQQLCAALDPADHLGRDWCLLTVRLGLAEKLASLDETAPSYSRTARLLDTWITYSSKDANIGTLIRKLQDLGRNDAVEILFRNAPLYRILPSSLQAFYSNEINDISQYTHSIQQLKLTTNSPANTISRTYLSR